MTGASEKSQWLLFDESNNLPELEVLKALTSGICTVDLNRKSHGRSFHPRPDIQIIVCCNKSPYEVYGKWDAKIQRKYMDVHVQQIIEDRFHIIKLDGPVEDDRRVYCDPVLWSHEEYVRTIQDTFYDGCQVLNEEGDLMYRSVKKALYMSYLIHERRMGHQRQTHLRHFAKRLKEGMDEEDAKTVDYAIRGQFCGKDLLYFVPDDTRTVQLHGYPERRRRREAAMEGERGGGLLVVRPDSEEFVPHVRQSAFDIIMPPRRPPPSPRRRVAIDARAHDHVQGQLLPEDKEAIEIIQDQERQMDDFPYADDMEAMNEL